MCDCLDNTATFYEKKTVKGRIEHQCAECLRIIEQGEWHEYAKGLWEGSFSSYRTCELCSDMIKETGIDCYCHGYVMDELDERDFADMQSVVDFHSRRRVNYDRIESANRLLTNA